MHQGKYRLNDEVLTWSSGDFANLLATSCDKYPITPTEDGMAKNDWGGWATPAQMPGKCI